ncbi:MAG: ComF family protein [Deltaproteobacteria bacterium]|nr:ComF family protein [Deltaproteobacteria bacterium]
MITATELGKRAKTFALPFLDVFFPNLCRFCGKTASDSWLCNACLDSIRKISDAAHCVKCGRPFAGAIETPGSCGECLTEKRWFEAMRSAFFYDGNVAEAVRDLKYNKKTELARPMAKWVSLAAKGLGEGGFDTVMPVPLHLKRLRERGFNQSLLIAREVSKRLGARLSYDNLERIRHTRPQVELEHNERSANVKDAFALRDKGAVKNRRVLLIDDVCTTGATIAECSKVLARAGAAVYVATFAMAVKL